MLSAILRRTALSTLFAVLSVFMPAAARAKVPRWLVIENGTVRAACAREIEAGGFHPDFFRTELRQHDLNLKAGGPLSPLWAGP